MLFASNYLTSPLPHFTSIYLILHDRELYFTDWGVAPCIQRCSLQATNCKVMVSAPDVSHPNALAISYTKLTNDKYSRSLYWTDSKTKAIGYIDLDGKPTDLHVTLIPIE